MYAHTHSYNFLSFHLNVLNFKFIQNHTILQKPCPEEESTLALINALTLLVLIISVR